MIINNAYIESTGGNYGAGIKSNNKLMIKRGIIKVIGRGDYEISAIYGKEVLIIDGTITAKSRIYSGIGCTQEGTITITGGNILSKGKDYPIGRKTDGDYNIEKINPTNGTNNLYETKIKLNDLVDGKKITSIVTSDTLSYGINDMYTLEEGMLYLYLPSGERTITIECEGKTYSGTVITSENGSITTLQEV